MSLDRLKALNKPDKPLMNPEQLLEEYNLKIPFYGIPPEVLNTLVRMITEVAKHQAPMQDRIALLPTWEDWTKDIMPTVETAMNAHTEAVKTLRNNLQWEFQNQGEQQRNSLSALMDKKLNGLEQTLIARDNMPKKLRLKWMGIGAALPVLLSGLLWLLKVLL